MNNNPLIFETVLAANLPICLQALACPPPQLHIRGAALTNLLQRPCVAIVGSRKVTAYGSRVTAQLAGELAGRGIVVISGLALGVDAIAHQAALEAGGLTIAVLPGGVDKVYPTRHTNLAERIVAGGGALVSEYALGSPAYKQHFIARNRIVAGLSNALLITEATQKSGTLHTARFALELGRDVLSVPGNITSPASAGTNGLLVSGAHAITGSADVLHILGINLPADQPAPKHRPRGANAHQQIILDLMETGLSDGAELAARSQLGPSLFNQHLTMLELAGHIRPLGNNQWVIRA